MRLIRKALSHIPLLRYMEAVEEGTREQEAHLEEQQAIAAIHTRRARYWFIEKNHVTPLIIDLIGGNK